MRCGKEEIEMKPILRLLFIAFVLVAVGLQADGKSPRKAQKNSKTVYYVVMGSYSSLEGAKEATFNAPDGLESPVYEAKVNGKTYYRICVSCYYSKAKAEAEVKFLKEYYGDGFWIWPSKGLAKCVYCPYGLSGERLTPLKPR